MDSIATGIAGLNGFLVLAGPLNIPVLLLYIALWAVPHWAFASGLGLSSVWLDLIGCFVI